MKYLFPALLLFCAACSSPGRNIDREKVKQEIRAAESLFCADAASKGIADAFYIHADSNAVIKRQNDTLIQGRENIRAYYSNPFYSNAAVTWAPDFIDVSEDGQMAWTYGHYEWIFRDSANTETKYTGVFHTVWKKQKNGTWKYVWD